jgi:hypothetical protein
MAKVKKVETKLQTGKAATPKSAPAKTETPQPKPGKAATPNTVYALKNGIERGFPRQIWDHLPAGKEGWKEIVQAPAIPAAKKQAVADNSQSDKPSYEDAVNTYKELFGEAPGQDLSLDEIIEAVEAKKGEQNNG